MPKRPLSILISAAAGAATLVLATPAWAAQTPGADPKGANGTVKIDGIPLDDGVANEPHVSCEFEVDFFGFDKDQRADIVFAVHPPTGKGKQLLRRDAVLISDDPAGGAKPDPDKTFTFSADDLGLSQFTPHPKQGFHVKLTVDLVGAPGAGKHKVFWLKPCETGPGSTPPATPGGPPGSPPAAGKGGGAGNGGGLPVTGVAAGSIALAGGAMVAGGAALLLLIRRRREDAVAS